MPQRELYLAFMANNVSQFPSILQAKADQSFQHRDEIRKYYLGNVLLVRSHTLKGTEKYSFISVTPSNCTGENLRGNHESLHISIICYIVCIALPSWHKVKVGFVQEFRKGEMLLQCLWLVGRHSSRGAVIPS